MPKVTICRGRDTQEQNWWADDQSALSISTSEIKEMLGGGTDKLILSIRDNMMIKCLRSGRSVILIGEHKEIQQIERIEEILEVQGNIDGKKYPYFIKDFKG